jgi:hypothetical protein
MFELLRIMEKIRFDLNEDKGILLKKDFVNFGFKVNKDKKIQYDLL